MTEIEALRAELERVEKERDEAREVAGEWRESRVAMDDVIDSLHASMGRAKELAERGVATWDTTDSGKHFAAIARLLSGKAEEETP